MTENPPPLSPEEAAQPVNRGMLRAEVTALGADLRSEMVVQGTDLRAEMAALGADLRSEMAAMGTDLRAEMAAQGAELRSEMAAMGAELRAEMTVLGRELRTEMATQGEDLRGEIRASRVLIEDVRGTLDLVLERLSDAIMGNAQIARVDGDIADVRTRADAAAALGPQVRDHERRIHALEERRSL